MICRSQSGAGGNHPRVVCPLPPRCRIVYGTDRFSNTCDSVSHLSWLVIGLRSTRSFSFRTVRVRTLSGHP